MLVGDAAGYIEPFTGDGVAAAISGAIAVSDLIGKSHGQWTPDTQAAWTTTYRRLWGSAGGCARGSRQHCIDLGSRSLLFHGGTLSKRASLMARQLN